MALRVDVVRAGTGSDWQCLRHLIGRYETDSHNLDPSRGCVLILGEPSLGNVQRSGWKAVSAQR